MDESLQISEFQGSEVNFTSLHVFEFFGGQVGQMVDHLAEAGLLLVVVDHVLVVLLEDGETELVLLFGGVGSAFLGNEVHEFSLSCGERGS